MKSMRALLEAWRSGETDPPPVMRLIGMTLLGFGEGTSEVGLRTDERHYNPMGIVHGGILCDLADAAMGVAVASTMQEGEIFTTTSLQMYYFLQVREATLTARSTMVRRGQRTVYVECEIVDEGDRLVAKASSACLVTRSDPELGVLEPV